MTLRFALLPAAFVLAVAGSGSVPVAEALDVLCPVEGGDAAGSRVATGGDFDGDGVADIAVGSPCAAGTRVRRAGRVTVFSGTDGSRLRTIGGTQELQRLGAAVAFVGDLDGDDRDDLAAGSFGWTTTGGLQSAGKIEVVTVDRRVLLTIEGSANLANFGEAIAGVPDVNGDAVPDLLVGAGDDRESGERRGRAYLISGKNGATLDTSTGVSRFDAWGSTVAVAHDVDGGGTVDVVVAGNLADNVSAAGANHGKFQVLAGEDFSQVLLQAFGNSEDNLGEAVAPAGSRGLYVGSPGSDPQDRSKAGTVTLYSWAGVLSAPITEPSPQTTAGFGSAVIVVGDVDGDAVPDVIASAPTADANGETDAGRVHAYSGDDHAHLWTAVGSRSGQRLGQWLAAGPDFNGDGVADVLAGAPGDVARARRGAGTVRILSGVDGDEIRRVLGRRGLETRLFVAGRRTGGVAQVRSFDSKGRRKELRFDVFRGLEEGDLSLAVLEEAGGVLADSLKLVVATGTGALRDDVRVYWADGRSLVASSFRGIGNGYVGGVNVAAGNVGGTSTDEIAAVEADAADGDVGLKVWERFAVDPLAGTIQWRVRNGFSAFTSSDVIESEPVLAGGANVTIADIINGGEVCLVGICSDDSSVTCSTNGDCTHEEILVGPTEGAPAVRIFDGDGNVLEEWLAFLPGGPNQGTQIVVGDLDADGIREVLAAPTTGQPWIRAFDVNGTPKLVDGTEVNFFAFVSGAPSGIRIAVADVDLDTRGEILIASGAGILGSVRAFEPDGTAVSGWKDFLPFGPFGRGGLAIAGSDRLLRH